MASCAAAYTREFIVSSLPRGARSVLEVGCGNGEVAALLNASGLSVLAIDSNAAAVAEARARGVDARVEEWPAPIDQRFDAVIFTRSLHHVHDLSGGIRAALERLSPAGRIIVEEFAFEEAEERTLAWFRSLAALLAEAGAADPASEFVRDLVTAPGPLADWWKAQHHHDLHSSARIEAELRSRFERVEGAGSAYFFRYLLTEGVSAATAKALLEHEKRLIELGMIAPLGRRFVAGRA